MLKIVAKYPGQKRDVVDTATTIDEAEYLLKEYRMAFGPKPELKITGTRGVRFNKEIVKLRKQGLTNREIAAKLKLDQNYVQHLVSQLVDQGLIERREAGGTRDPKIVQRNLQMVALKDKGVTYRQIGERFGLKFETVKATIYDTRKRMKK